jgi:hypothetical protein
MAYRPQAAHYEERARGPGRLGVGLLLSAALALTFVALSLWQITDEDTAKPALGDALNALVEGDAVVARNYDDLRSRAEASQPGEMLELRDYPIALPIERDDVLASSEGDITSSLLDRGVDELYDDGTDALRDEGATDGAGRFTAAGAVGEFLGFLRGDVHAILGVLTLVLAGISVLLAIILVALFHGFGRAVALTLSAFVASLPLLFGGLVAHLYARASADRDGEYVRQEFMAIAQDLSWVAVRNGAALMLAAAMLLITSIVCARISDARRV